MKETTDKTQFENDSKSADWTVNYVSVKSKLNWDEYFMLQAMLASYKSKDPNTKVGCVIVDENNHQITMGYNGTIAGIDETLIPWGNNREVPLEHQKYGYVIHGEANAISHAKGSLADARVYVTLFPCNECAKLLASHRVKEIIFLSDKYADTPENRIAKKIFQLSKISYRQLSISESTLESFGAYLKSLV
jgi:dCMP deaminase